MITVARASIGDAGVLAEIMGRAWNAAFRGILSDAVIAQYTEAQACTAMFSELLAAGEGTMYLAAADGIPMGLLYWQEEGDSLRIEGLLTVPEAWGRGIGAALMERALSDAAALKKKHVRVWPFVQNPRARRFYEKWGFRQSGATRMSDAREMEYVHNLEVERMNVS